MENIGLQGIQEPGWRCDQLLLKTMNLCQPNPMHGSFCVNPSLEKTGNDIQSSD